MNQFFNKLCFALILAAATFISCSDDDSSSSHEPIKIGVLLPITGDWALGYETPMEWAIENVNKSGGIGGRPLELVYKDIGVLDEAEAAQQLIDDPEIVAVVGTDGSSSTFALAPKFIEAQKVIVTPAATSAEIFRAFAGQKYIWRTVESDIAQVRTMLMVAARRGINKVALVTSTDVYGTTFFDWFGFFATELGMQITDVIRYDQEAEACNAYMRQAIEGQPEMILVSPSDPNTAVCMVKSMETANTTAQLLFSDGGTYTSIIDNLGEEAEGLEGISLSTDPQSGFDIAYRVQFNSLPPPYAANAYDAISIIAYGLQRSGGAGGEQLANAMAEVVSATGDETSWDLQGIGEALSMIAQGNLPDISGATGPLLYDMEFQTDLVTSTYGFWRVEYGEFVTVEYLSSDDTNNPRATSGTSIFRTLASEAAKQNLSNFTDYNPPEKEGLWALIGALSENWDNYRHQADALAMYNLLKENGVADDHIILIMADDLANNQSNSLPGTVRNYEGGPNLYQNVEIDYKLDRLSSSDLFDILSGVSSSRLPKVIESTASDNIFVFLVGHGNDQGVIFDTTNLSPSTLSSRLSRMYTQNKYRRVLIEIEACHGGTMGTELNMPGVILFAGANPYENSFGANYDGQLDNWLADQFAYSFFKTAIDNPSINLHALYSELYLKVNGSHVSVYNSPNFGDASRVKLQEFLEP